METFYYFVHDSLHMCFWTLPSILVGVGMIVMALVHNRNQRKRQEDFEKELQPASENAQA